jgi:hypothetical protein
MFVASMAMPAVTGCGAGATNCASRVCGSMRKIPPAANPQRLLSGPKTTELASGVNGSLPIGVKAPVPGS